MNSSNATVARGLLWQSGRLPGQRQWFRRADDNAQSPEVFGAPLVLPSPAASQVAIADMNADGLPDLISADYNVSLFVQTSPGVFANPVSLYTGGANWVAVGDLNYPSSAGSTAQSLEVADVNGDALPDIIIGGSAQLGVLLQNPASRGTFAAVASTPVSNASQIAVADVNGDGLADLIVPNGPTRTLVDGVYTNTPGVLLQNASQPGTFAAVTAFP